MGVGGGIRTLACIKQLGIRTRARDQTWQATSLSGELGRVIQIVPFASRKQKLQPTYVLIVSFHGKFDT